VRILIGERNLFYNETAWWKNNNFSGAKGSFDLYNDHYQKQDIRC
jgi:hypothetical protein